MKRCAVEWRPQRLPTATFSPLMRERIPSGTRASWNTISASPSSRAARTVRRSGAPDLLTVRAARLLGEADIVFHDALVPEGILSLIKGEKVAVGKRCGRHSTAQRFINKRLADAAQRYRVVVRLKGGDPMLFGRAHEEIRFPV